MVLLVSTWPQTRFHVSLQLHTPCPARGPGEPRLDLYGGHVRGRGRRPLARAPPAGDAAPRGWRALHRGGGITTGAALRVWSFGLWTEYTAQGD